MEGLNRLSLFRCAAHFEAYAEEKGPPGLMDKLRSGDDIEQIELAAMCDWMGLSSHLFMVRENMTPATHERLGRLVDLACSSEGMQGRLAARAITGPMVVEWGDGASSLGHRPRN